jgi:CyaY protein
MLDEAQFRRESDKALESLKQALIAAEDDSGTFEFEDNTGVFLLPKTGEALIPLTERLLREHLGDPSITLV